MTENHILSAFKKAQLTFKGAVKVTVDENFVGIEKGIIMTGLVIHRNFSTVAFKAKNIFKEAGHGVHTIYTRDYLTLVVTNSPVKPISGPVQSETAAGGAHD